MNVFELTRALIDIESVTNSEKRVGDFLFTHVSNLSKRYAGQVERMEVEPDRFNVFVHWGQPVVTLSTHMDTVPPFFPSREDEETIWGRGACDAKGIIAAMIAAAEKLLATGKKNFGLLFVVGEEVNGAGALVAARNPRGSRYLINGEPTENKIALGTKGALRYEITARGRAAHSAYPELGHSAIETLLDVLQAIRAIKLPEDELLGRSTLNIGTIKGGRAPNVIADHAQAEIMFRLVGSAATVREALAEVLAGRAEGREQYTTPAQRLGPFPGLPTTVVSFTTDIPSFGTAWGKPFLIGPGSIHAAHTADEHISKQQLLRAVDIYAEMATTLASGGLEN
ncbi:MAG TPA: M20/M25/M40 family metallo-hydrolase [Candidatus Dormibacteraeota bacterium]|nr:M20/M25/M40 family metallo-hydrolase [Candidatus Dormibacteraeota bacterium]